MLGRPFLTANVYFCLFLSLFQFGRVNYGIVSFTLTMIYPLFFCKKGNNFHVYSFFLMHIVAQIIRLSCQTEQKVKKMRFR